MAHPMNKFRQANVERKRVGELTKGYATGGAAKGTLAKALTAHRAEHKALGMGAEGEMARPRRASGGKVGKKATTVVNVIMGGQQKPEEPPAPMMAPPPPPPPPGPPPGAMAPPPGGPPPGAMPPPGMPMRASGGKVGAPQTPREMDEDARKTREVLERRGIVTPARAKGGGVKSKGMNVGTKVQHSPAHMEVGKMNRPRVVTFATGGGVVSFKASGGRVPLPKPRPEGKEPQPSDLYAPSDVKRLEQQRAKGGRITSPAKGGMGPKLPGGAGGGKGRLAKEKLY